MPTFRLPRLGDFAYALDIKQGVINFHGTRVSSGPIYRGRKANPSGAMVEVVKTNSSFFLHNFLYIVICT